MRAAYYEKNGSARDVLSLGEIDTPKPGPGEVLVRLKTSGVNPSDVKSREGRTRKIVFPRVIPHSDGAGDIEAVGDGVPQSRVGERVWTWNGQWKRAFGTCADYIVLPAALAVKLPDHVSYEAGACLGIPAMTAYHAVEVAGPAKTVLVSGGAGGVGHYAIQFAKARGATVITTVSSDAKAKIARDAGADHTIDYKRENVGERVMAITNKAGVDAVIEMDFSGNAKLMPSVLHPRSTVVVYGNSSAGSDHPVAILPAERHHHPLHFRLRADAGRARRRGVRHQPHAGEQDAAQQRGAHAAAQGHRRRARGRRTGQGFGQRGGFDELTT